MKLKRVYLFLTVLIAALLLSGCFQIEQEYWINEDGSGQMRMDMAISESLMEMGDTSDSGLPTSTELENDFSTNLYVTNMTVDEYEADGYFHTVVLLDISDMQAFFLEAQSNESTGEGMPVLEKLENGSFRFRQMLDMGGTDGSEEMDDMTREMMASAFANQYWTVKLHAPNVVQTNGTIDEKTAVVEWRIPMGDLMSGSEPVEITAEYRPLPAWRAYVPWILGGGLLIGLCGVGLLGIVGAIFFLRKKKAGQTPA